MRSHKHSLIFCDYYKRQNIKRERSYWKWFNCTSRTREIVYSYGVTCVTTRVCLPSKKQKMIRPKWTKVANVFACLIIQSTFGILYFTFDVCTKVDEHKERGHLYNLTYSDKTKIFCENKNNSDKSSQDIYLSTLLTSTSTCAKLQNGTKKFENSVFFSKLEDVQWVRTCMISVMGVVAFLVSVVSANCSKPSHIFTELRVPFLPFRRWSSIIFYKFLLFIGCCFMLCGTFMSAITVKKSLPLFILTWVSCYISKASCFVDICSLMLLLHAN